MMVPFVVAATAFTGACGSSTTAAKPAVKPVGTTTTAAAMKGMDHGATSHDHPASSGGTGADQGLGMLHNGHHVEMTYTKLNAADQTSVDKLLAISRKVGVKYPTLGVAVDAGFRRAGPYSPGLGIHYSAPWAVQGLNPDGIMDATDAAHPLIVIFDGTERSAKFAGFMYYSVAEKQPGGFAGKNDFWHYHTNVCTVFAKDGTDAPFGADRSGDVAECKKLGGVTMPKTQWMVHVWSIPGYEVSDKDGGVFAEVNPALKCADGTYFVMDVKDMKDHPLNVCKSELKK